jgi:predicted nucleotidyltransferase
MLPDLVARGLEQFVASMRSAFGPDLKAIVLFGSAADETLRPVSDVNVLVVLRRFDREAADRARNAVALARAAIRLAPMFLLEGELPLATRAFAVKFGDMLRRRRLLHGDDPLAGIAIPRAARIERLRQVLLNLALRHRAGVIEVGDREEQLAHAIAGAAGPLRAAAAALLELEGGAVASPKSALARVAHELLPDRDGALLAEVSLAREHGRVTPTRAVDVSLFLIDLARAMGDRVERLDAGNAS